jgi:hypothetical protein
VAQVFPEVESEAALFWNGSTKAAPDDRAGQQLFYVVNEDQRNR